METDKEKQHTRHRGHIRNIHFKNIAVTGTELPKSYLIGYNDAHSIENVVGPSMAGGYPMPMPATSQ
ncbi:MAG: hypothetical protein ACYS4T_16200 [Planctomycetota bacterium]